MRSQRIGQGFESPRLHHHKQTASQVRCRLLMAAKPAGERTCAQHFTCACLFALFSCIQASDLSVRAGSAAAAADAFARAVARAERPACKSISPVRHLPLWRSSPRHDLPRHRKVGVLRIFAKPAGERTCARHYIKQRVSLPSHFGSHCVHFIRARRFGGGAADAFALPRRPQCVRHPAQTRRIFIVLPLWRSSPRLHPRGFSPLADVSCSVTSLLHTHLSLINGIAKAVPFAYGGGEYILWLTLSILLRCGIAKRGEVVYHILRM